MTDRCICSHADFRLQQQLARALLRPGSYWSWALQRHICKLFKETIRGQELNFGAVRTSSGFTACAHILHIYSLIRSFVCSLSENCVSFVFCCVLGSDDWWALWQERKWRVEPRCGLELLMLQSSPNCGSQSQHAQSRWTTCILCFSSPLTCFV
jgi:hypothetical protein